METATVLEPAEAEATTRPRPRPNIVRRLYDWCLGWAETPYGTPALFVISFMESSFFPIPPDVLQIALSVSKPKRAFYYAAVSAIASVLGAIVGWAIGMWFWDSFQHFFFDYVPGFTQANFDKVSIKYHDNAFMALLLAAFTPIPFKIFTIASGVFHVALPTVIVASAIGRSGRFFLVGGTIYFFGPRVRDLIDKYFNLATVVLAVLGIGGFLVIKLLH